MNDTIEKTNLELKDDVIAELKYEQIVKVMEISVLFKNGKVTLERIVYHLKNNLLIQCFAGNYKILKSRMPSNY